MKIGVLTITEAARPAPEDHRTYCAAWQYEHFTYGLSKENPADLFRYIKSIAPKAEWTLVVHQSIDLAVFGLPLEDIVGLPKQAESLILIHSTRGETKRWPTLFRSLMLIKHESSTQTFLDIAASATDVEMLRWWNRHEYGRCRKNVDDRLFFASKTSNLVDHALILPQSVVGPGVKAGFFRKRKGTMPRKSEHPASRLPSNVRYWTQADGYRNFGDYLTEFFFERLFYGVDVKAATIHVIGSVISDEWLPTTIPEAGNHGDRSNTTIYWACGARSPGSLSLRNRERCRIPCVRGPLTRDAFSLPEDTPLGDPGLLLPSLYSPQLSAAYADKTIAIPHIGDPLDDNELKRRTGCDIVLWPKLNPSMQSLEEFIDRIASAKFVLCGSLHAAITAAAYGVPFAYFNGGKIDAPFKWKDFSASVNIPCRFVDDIDSGMEHYKRSIKPTFRPPILTRILLVAPFPIRPKALLRVYERDIKVHGILAIRSIAETSEHPFFMDFHGAAHLAGNATEKDASRALPPQSSLEVEHSRQTGKLKMELWRHSIKN